MRYTFYAILLLTIVGCNPRLTAPKLVEHQKYTFGGDFSADSINIDSKWWYMFGDSTLNNLIERAVSQNKNIEIAASRIEEAHCNLITTRAQYLPYISAEVEAEGVYSGKTNDIAQSYHIIRPMSWEVPLFGSLRHATRGAKADIAYEEWQYRGVKLALEAEVATTYFTLLQYQQNLFIAERSSELRREMVQLIDSLHLYGFASGVDLEQAHSLLYTAEADIPLYNRAIAQTLLSLSTLLGEEPDATSLMQSIRHQNNLSKYRTYDISIGVPSDLLHRRPDLMSALHTMQKQAAAVGVARAARLPSISISLNGGTATTNLRKIFSGKSWITEALGSISQPILNFGGLRRREMAARQAYKQSLLAYEQCYIEALADVEDALVSLTTYRKELSRYGAMVKANRNIAMKTYALYRNGLSDYLDVIDAERSLYASQMQFENLVAQQYINYINLCKALGGGGSGRQN